MKRDQLWVIFLLIIPFPFCSDRANDDGKERYGKEVEEQKERTEEGDLIRCFAYHRFGNDRYPSTNISLDRFEAHLEFLKKNDHTVLTLGEALKRLEKNKDLPDRTTVLTMDDGYKSIMTGALPLLEEYGFKATIFVCTEYVGGKNNLSWKELRTLQDKGFEIGDHSHSHAHFLNKPEGSIRTAFRKDLERSRKQFKENLGTVPELYAYPYGEYNPAMQEVLKKIGYEAAVAQRSGVIHGGADRYAMPRFPMTSFYGKAEKFREKAQMYPLRTSQERPQTPIVSSDNPPTISFRIESVGIDPGKLQCFVDGSKDCDLKAEKKGDELEVRMTSRRELTDRRTLYTITAPGPEGEWHWYSKLWVLPEKDE